MLQPMTLSILVLGMALAASSYTRSITTSTLVSESENWCSISAALYSGLLAVITAPIFIAAK
jgi:hypothetical protein